MFIDNFGNEYYESFSLDVTGALGMKTLGYVVYNVEDYLKFYAEFVAADYTYSGNTFTISIFTNDNSAPIEVISGYTKQTGKRQIEIDLKNVTKLKIVLDASGRASGICFVNATLSK